MPSTRNFISRQATSYFTTSHKTSHKHSVHGSQSRKIYTDGAGVAHRSLRGATTPAATDRARPKEEPTNPNGFTPPTNAHRNCRDQYVKSTQHLHRKTFIAGHNTRSEGPDQRRKERHQGAFVSSAHAKVAQALVHFFVRLAEVVEGSLFLRHRVRVAFAVEAAADVQYHLSQPKHLPCGTRVEINATTIVLRLISDVNACQREARQRWGRKNK